MSGGMQMSGEGQKSYTSRGCTCPGTDVREAKVLPLYITIPSFDDDDKCIALSVAVDHGTGKLGNTTSTVITRHA